jgi:hypothetical protein
MIDNIVHDCECGIGSMLCDLVQQRYAELQLAAFPILCEIEGCTVYDFLDSPTFNAYVW